MCMFGNATTMTFSASGMPVLTIKSIGNWERSRQVADSTPMSVATNAYATKCFGGVIDHGAIDIQAFFVPSIVATNDVKWTSQTAVITYSDGSQRSGVGRIVRWQDGGADPGEVMMANLQWQFAGPTITFTGT